MQNVYQENFILVILAVFDKKKGIFIELKFGLPDKHIGVWFMSRCLVGKSVLRISFCDVHNFPTKFLL